MLEVALADLQKRFDAVELRTRPPRQTTAGRDSADCNFTVALLPTGATARRVLYPRRRAIDVTITRDRSNGRRVAERKPRRRYDIGHNRNSHVPVGVLFFLIAEEFFERMTIEANAPAG